MLNSRKEAIEKKSVNGRRFIPWPQTIITSLKQCERQKNRPYL